MKKKLSYRDRHILLGAYMVLSDLNDELWNECHQEALFSKSTLIQEKLHPFRRFIEDLQLGIYRLLVEF